MQFLKETGEQAAENISSMLVIPSMVKQAVTMKTERGTPLSPVDVVNRIMPVTRLASETIQTAQDAGPEEAAYSVLGNLTGMRQARSMHADTAILDAKLKEAQRELLEKKKAVDLYSKNGPPSKLKQALEDLDKAADEVRRVAAYRKANKPPKAERPPKGTTAPLRERNREAVQEWRDERKEKSREQN